MNILLISANNERMPDPVPPIGIGFIAGAVLKKNHQCKILDMNFISDFKISLLNEIKDFQPSVIGISFRNVDNSAFPAVVSYIEHYKNIVKVCREELPNIPIIAGGPAFSLFPDELYGILKLDYGVVGEGEYVFTDIIESINNGNKMKPGIYSSKNQELDINEFSPAFDLLNIKEYFKQSGSINIQTKRGCNFKCCYCSYPLLEGRKIRFKNPKIAVDEIEYCLNKYSVDYYFFVDNVFNIMKEHSVSICEEILRRGLNIKWTAYVSPAGLDKATLEMYKKAGCASLDFGIDSASFAGLKALSKDFSPLDIKNCSLWCKELGIKFNHSIILAVPGETKETLEESISNIMECNPTAVTGMIGIRVYKNTALSEKLIKEGWIKEKDINTRPVFYIEENVKEYALERATELSKKYKNWVFPGITHKMDPMFFDLLRSRGVKGPLWGLLG